MKFRGSPGAAVRQVAPGLGGFAPFQKALQYDQFVLGVVMGHAQGLQVVHFPVQGAVEVAFLHGDGI